MRALILLSLLFLIYSCEVEQDDAVSWSARYVINVEDAENNIPVLESVLTYRFTYEADNVRHEIMPTDIFGDPHMFGTFTIEGKSVKTKRGAQCPYKLVIIHPPRKDGYIFIQPQPGSGGGFTLFPNYLDAPFENNRSVTKTYFLKRQ